jgi:hypothetical protein
MVIFSTEFLCPMFGKKHINYQKVFRTVEKGRPQIGSLGIAVEVTKPGFLHGKSSRAHKFMISAL